MEHLTRLSLAAFGGVVLSLLTTSCASTPREPKLPKVDYANYEKVEETVGSKMIRSVTTSPCLKHHAHWGHWGGVGAYGGPPVDLMDELFRRHDICYDLMHSGAKMQEADRELVSQLKVLPPDSLTEEGEKFRKKTISYFSSPVSKVVGKPLSAHLYKVEHPEGRFARDDSVENFMDLRVSAAHLVYQ